MIKTQIILHESGCAQMLQEKIKASTDDLFFMLENKDDIKVNWKSVSEHMNALPFHKYLGALISERNISIPHVGVKALLSRSFTYQIFSGDRVPSKDIILRIALALEFSLDDTQRLLKLADRGALYPKIKRDAVIIYCINNKPGLYKTDEMLVSLGQEPLL